MKVTMHVDDNLLARAMSVARARSKTAAVDLALREFVRRGELAQVLAAGFNKSAAQLRETLDPTYDLDSMRRKDLPGSNGRKPRSRR